MSEVQQFPISDDEPEVDATAAIDAARRSVIACLDLAAAAAPAWDVDFCEQKLVNTVLQDVLISMMRYIKIRFAHVSNRRFAHVCIAPESTCPECCINIICKMSMDLQGFTDFTQYLMFAKIGHPKTKVQFFIFK